MPDAARNHAPAAGARNLILIDARLSSRSPRYTRPGKGGQAKSGRDWKVYYLIDQLSRGENLTPTRNEASEPFSACDVVAKAADLPYKTVERIWTTRSQKLRKA